MPHHGLRCMRVLMRSGTTCHLSLALPFFSWSVAKSAHSIIAPACLGSNQGQQWRIPTVHLEPGNHTPHFSGGFCSLLFCLSDMKIIPAPRAPGKNGIKHCLCRPMLIGFHLYSRGRVSQGYNLVVMVGTINTRKYEFIATEKRTFRWQKYCFTWNFILGLALLNWKLLMYKMYN